MPRTARLQFEVGEPIMSVEDLRYGDRWCFKKRQAAAGGSPGARESVCAGGQEYRWYVGARRGYSPRQ